MTPSQIKNEALTIIEKLMSSLDTTDSNPYGNEHFIMFVTFTDIKDLIENGQPLSDKDKQQFTEVLAEYMKTDYDEADDKGYSDLLTESLKLVKYGEIYQQYCI